MLALLGAPRDGVHYAITLNGRPLTPEQWALTVLEDRDLLVLRACVAGGDKEGNKQIVGLLAMLVITSAALAFAPGLAGVIGIGGKFGTPFVTGLLSLIGAAGVSQLIRIPPKPEQKLDDEQLYSLSGTSNAVAPYAPIPYIVGTVRIYPPHAALPYTEFEGQDQYLRTLMYVAMNEVVQDEASIQIGDTPLSYFGSVTKEIRNGTATDAPRELYTNQQRTLDLEILLPFDYPQVYTWTVQRTEIETDEIVVETTWPGGIWHIAKAGGNIDRAALLVVVVIRVSVAGQEAWHYWPSGAGESLVRELRASPFRKGFRITQGWLDAHMTGGSGQRYDVGIGYIAEETGDWPTYAAAADCYWTALRSVHNEDPIQADNAEILGPMARPIATLALRIKATDQLGGMLDNVSVLVSAPLPSWSTGGGWAAATVENGRNPAWAYMGILKGGGLEYGLTDARIDLERFETWAARCTVNAWTVDYAFGREMGPREALALIAACGRATPAEIDGKFSIVMDNPSATPANVFTPMTSRNYRGSKAFADRPHALRIRFDNAEYDYLEDLVYAFDDGYSQLGDEPGTVAATRYEEVTLPGCTSYEQAWKQGRYLLLCNRLRPEVHTFETTVEHLTFTRGDTVELTHDVPMFGIGFGRIKTVVFEVDFAESPGEYRGITLNNAVEIDDANAHYGVRIRLTNAGHVGEVLSCEVANPGVGFYTTLEFLPAIGKAAILHPHEDDLVVFGQLGSETVQLIVKDITPREDMTALITALDAAPEVHATGPVPPYDPHISVRPRLQDLYPPAPRAMAVRSDESCLLRGTDGTWQSRIVIGVVYETGTFSPAVRLMVRYRQTIVGIENEWIPMAAFEGMATEAWVMPVQDGQEYDVQLQTVSAWGLVSGWVVACTGHEVIGKTSPPADPFWIGVDDDGTIRWALDEMAIDFAGVRLRYRQAANTEWEGANPAIPGDGLINAWGFPIQQLPEGPLTLLLKTVDTSGIESANAVSCYIERNPAYDTVTMLTYEYHGSGWYDGTLIQGEYDAITGNIRGIETAGGENAPFWGDEYEPFFGADGAMFWSTSTYYGDVEWVTTNVPWLYWGFAVHPYLRETPTMARGEPIMTYQRGPGLPTDLTDRSGELPFPGRVELIGGEGSNAPVRWRIRATGGSVRPEVERIAEAYEGQTIREVVSSVELTTAAGGDRIPLTQTYFAILSCVVGIREAGSLAYVRIVDMDATTGILLKGYNDAGARCTGTVDLVVRGF